MKFIFMVVGILILVSQTNVVALTFGIAPERMTFEGIVGEEICREFSLIGDEELIFEGAVKWSEEETRRISDYKIESGEFGLEANYPRRIGNGTQMLCIIGNHEGKYYGALFYNIEGTNYGVGTWINLELTKKKSSFFSEEEELPLEIISKSNSQNLRMLFFNQIVATVSLGSLLVILIKKKLY